MTEIQFKTYLSYNILKEYLVYLLENDLIEYIEGDRLFKTARKGMHFLTLHIEWKSYWSPKWAGTEHTA
jgi:predicted transcriptional regulator